MNLTFFDYLVMAFGVLAFTALLILPFYSMYVEKLRKNMRSTHPLVRFDNAINRKVLYRCNCTVSHKVYLGAALAGWFPTLPVIGIPLFVFAIVFKAPPLVPIFIIAASLFYVRIFFQIRKEMITAHHTNRCSNEAALRALRYQMQGSWFEIEKKKHKNKTLKGL